MGNRRSWASKENLRRGNGRKRIETQSQSPEEYQRSRAAQINAQRARYGLAALEAGEAIQWERAMRLGRAA